MNGKLDPCRLAWTVFLNDRTNNTCCPCCTKKLILSFFFCLVEAPIKTGELIIQNILDTGVDVVATKNISKKTRNYDKLLATNPHRGE